MFKKIKSLFVAKAPQLEDHKEESPPEEPEEPEEVAKPPLPDVIDIPWNDDIARITNINRLIVDLHGKIKDLLYSNKLKENNIFRKLEEIEEIRAKKIGELKEKHGVSEANPAYKLEMPKSPGNSATLKKE